MNAFLSGFVGFFEAFGFIFRNRMARYYLIPVVIWLLLVAGSTFSLAAWLSPIIREFLNRWLDSPAAAEHASFWSMMRDWLHTGLQFAATWVLNLLIFYFLGRLMKYVILMITSPLLAWLSEKTEEILTGKTYPFSIPQLLSDALRGIMITLRNLTIETLIIAAGFVLSFIFPPAGLLITTALFLLNCYFMGFSMYDYYTERRKMNVRSSVHYMRKNRMRLMGLGFAFNLMSWIPFADWVIAPVNGAVGAVLSMRNEAEFRTAG